MQGVCTFLHPGAIPVFSSSVLWLANSVHCCCCTQVVREDKNLDQLRSDPRFTKLIDEYDEPVFNSGALK